MAAMHTFIAIVATSGAGKSTLILNMLERFVKRLAIVKSLTTRPSRGVEDEPFYDIVSREEFERRRAAGRILQSVEYAGHLYGNDREHVDVVLRDRVGISALIESSVPTFRSLGYRVSVVKIVPAEGGLDRGSERRIADAEQAKTDLAADLLLVNSFASGGKEHACDELATFVTSLL